MFAAERHSTNDFRINTLSVKVKIIATFIQNKITIVMKWEYYKNHCYVPRVLVLILITITQTLTCWGYNIFWIYFGSSHQLIQEVTSVCAYMDQWLISMMLQITPPLLCNRLTTVHTHTHTNSPGLLGVLEDEDW